MRQKDLKYFGDIQSGRMNSDDSPFAITTNEWVNAQNVRTGTTDKGVTGVVESIGGNAEIPKPADLASVVIGDQKWSAQDLNVTEYRDGSPIPEEQDPTAWAALTTGAWCWYNNDPATGSRLYNWYAVNDPRGLAPQGWWIPTQYEWQQLSNYLGGDSVSGGKLKETGLTHWTSPNTGATNSSGFTSLGNGLRRSDGVFLQINEYNTTWTASELSSNPNLVNYARLSYNSASLEFFTDFKASGLSVRAITFNSQYITIGSIEDTENNRFVYFDYDTDRNHQASIANIDMLTLGGFYLQTYDSRILRINAGDTFIITTGINAGTYICNSITYNSYGNIYEMYVNISLSPEVIITDIIYNVAGEDKVVCMYTDTNTQYNVLLSSQVLGGLNFDKNSLIHSAHIANSVLSFPDGINNEPRKINIESGIKANYPAFVTEFNAYTLPLNFDEITLIKKPPIFFPNFSKVYDSSYIFNFIANKSFQFAFQYQYYGNETSVIGTYSKSSRLNAPPISPATTTDNKIIVSMDYSEIITNSIQKINLIVRDSNSNYAYIAKTWDKNNPIDRAEIVDHQDHTTPLTFNFYNDSIGIVISEFDVLRPFDNVPIYSQTHEIAKQRYFLGNNIDGYDTPNTTSMNFVSFSTVTPSLASSQVYNAFPQISTYKCGIVFYDYAMRKCGVVTNNNCIITTPYRDYSYSNTNPYLVASAFNWAVSNANSIDEIPNWAYYYAPVLTENQNKRFFIQSFTNAPLYFYKDSTGNYVYNSVFSNLMTGIALPTSALNQASLGYVYAEGDVCILSIDQGSSTQIATLNVVGQDNDFILLQFQYIGANISATNIIYEIYSPYKTSTQEPFYEMGQIYKVNNPNTEYREYSNLNGSFLADSYIIKRTWNSINYFSSAMSPNDLYYKDWYTDAGKVNIITTLGQVNNNTEVVWSDTYISGTQINGSSTFRLGSQAFVSDDCGSITKLQNTSKVQDQGSVMLALCAVETNSMYLGETQITDSTGGVQFFSAGTSVIGTINILKGNYGCIDPASVVQYRGNVYFLDVSNGRWVQYSANGLDSISAIKMTRFWKNWCYKYMSLTKDEIEAFGNRPYVFATVDPSHDELLITIPKLDNNPPKGFLPDYPELVYPFDILDYQGKTISYKLGTGVIVQPHWQSAYTFNTEYFCTIQNRLFSFNEGNAWEHNQDNQNIFFGIYSQSRIMFTSNILPQMPKVYDNFLSESNIVPSFVYFYNEFPYLQTSDLTDDSFVQKEGIWYAQILRNKVVPTETGDIYTGLLTAEVMRNTNMFVLAQYSPTSSPLQLRILELGMSISKGHIV